MKFYLFVITCVFSIFLNIQNIYACDCVLEYFETNCPCTITNFYGEDSCQKSYECGGTVGTCWGVFFCNVYYDTIETEDPIIIEKNKKQCGSIVNIENQMLQEQLPLYGSNWYLTYSSDRVIGRLTERKFKQKITAPTDPDVTNVELIHTIDGVPTTYTYGVTNDIEYNYTWNGLNSSNEEVIAGLNQLIEIKYKYVDNTRKKIYESKPNVNFYNSRLLGLGGLTLSIHHFYNKNSEIIHLGDGNNRLLKAIKVNKTGNVIEKLDDSETNFDFYLVASEEGKEAFLFNEEGYHIETRSAITSKILYSFSYDINKRLTKVEDSFGNETNITRPNSTTVLIETHTGKISQLTINSDGFLVNFKTPNNEEYELTYSAVSGKKGLLIEFENPKGLISEFEYDSLGNLIKDSNNAGNSIEISSTNTLNTRLIQAISAEGRITEYFASLGEKGRSTTETTKPSGAIESESHQKDTYTKQNTDNSSIFKEYAEDYRFNQQVYKVVSEYVYSHGVTHNLYFSDDYIFDEEDLLNVQSHTHTFILGYSYWYTVYDGLTKTYTTTWPLYRTDKVKINDYDQVIETQYASFSPVQYNYDSYGRLNEIIQNTREWSFTYNTEHEIQSITNPLSQTTSYVYDTNGRVTEVTYPNSDKAYFEYDEIGNIKKIKAGTKPWHEFLYNLFGGLMEYVMPSLSAGNLSVQYQYNDDKQLTKIIRENSDEIDFIYGSTSGLLEKVETIEGDYNYNINVSTEQITSIEAPNNLKLNYTYLDDVVKTQVFEDQDNLSTLTYDYDNMFISSIKIGHVDLDSDVDHQVTLTYNEDLLLTEIGDLEITRDDSTSLIEETEIGNVKEYYFYNADYAEVSEYRAEYNGNQIYRQVHYRDALGRTTFSGEYNTSSYYNVRTYGYDSRGRLERSGIYFPNEKVYFYDDNSNRIKVEDRNGKVRQIGTYNNQDQLLTYVIQSDDEITAIFSYTYTYNDFGQRLTKTDSVSNIKEEYAYNSLGALTSYTRTNLSTAAVLKTITYTVDGLGRRLTRSVDGVLQTRYIYDEGIRLVGEVTPDGDTLTHYIYADKMHVPSYMVRNGVTYKFVTNEQGSVRYIVNVSTGAKAQDIIYDEFGIIIDDTNPGFQPFGFAGGIYDPETKLTRFGARDYDPEVGRWTAKDPIRFEGGDTNLYGYVVNDPVNFIDPFGLMKLPSDPSGLSWDWQRDYSHRDPNGERYRYKGGDRFLDFHKGRKGEEGWKESNHWHDSKNGKKCKDHLNPGDEIPDPVDPKMMPTPIPLPLPNLSPLYRILFGV